MWCTAWNGRAVVNREREETWKEMVLDCLRVLCEHLAGEPELNQDHCASYGRP
jgi:hypothetical protein